MTTKCVFCRNDGAVMFEADAFEELKPAICKSSVGSLTSGLPAR